MSLTTGRGPLSGDPAGRFSCPIPPHVVYVEPFRRRVRGVMDGRTVVDSERVLLVHRPGQPPAYAFPASDVRLDADLARPAGRRDGQRDAAPGAGLEREAGAGRDRSDAGLDRAAPDRADRWRDGDLARSDRGDGRSDGALTAAPQPEPEPEVPGYVRVPWDAVDAWYEEDEQVFLHPRNPYHRVECVPTSRRLKVEVAGVVLVDTTDTMGVYETALEPRLYVRPELVRRDLLVAGSARTYCPYKGTAWYWTAVVGDVVVEDVAWSYEDPLPESRPLRGLLGFDETRVTVIHDLPPAAEVPPAVDRSTARTGRSTA